MKVQAKRPPLHLCNLVGLRVVAGVGEISRLEVTWSAEEDLPGTNGDGVLEVREVHTFWLTETGDDDVDVAVKDAVRHLFSVVQKRVTERVQNAGEVADNPCSTCTTSRCCTLPYSAPPWVTFSEVAAMAAYLKTPVEKFIKLYLDKQEHWYDAAIVGELSWGEDGECPMLVDHNGQRRCGVYPVRPFTCQVGAERNCYLHDVATPSDQ